MMGRGMGGMMGMDMRMMERMMRNMEEIERKTEPSFKSCILGGVILPVIRSIR